nr:MAG TPA: hypothetical protein [Caudoviricetes sp.]
MTGMNPAERFALAKAVETGLKTVLPSYQREAADYANQVGATKLRAGEGSVTVVAPAPRIIPVDDRALLEWCRANAPHLIRESVDPNGVKQLCTARLADAGDGETVIDKHTGEVVAWAAIKPRDPYLTVRLPAAVKTAAADTIGSGLEAMADVLAGPNPNPLEGN